MKPKYKQATAILPFCPQCEEQLLGNGSYILPYQCACGVWRSDGKEYKVIQVKKNVLIN